MNATQATIRYLAAKRAEFRWRTANEHEAMAVEIRRNTAAFMMDAETDEAAKRIRRTLETEAHVHERAAVKNRKYAAFHQAMANYPPQK